MAELAQPESNHSPREDSCYGCFQFLNVIYAISGIGMVVLSTRVLVNINRELVTVMYGQFFIHAAFFILCGLVVMALTIFGIYSGWKRNRCTVFAYIAGLTVIFTIVIIGGFFLQPDLALSTQKEAMILDLKYYYVGPGGDEHAANDNTLFWDIMQDHYDCCGVTNPNDYKEVTNWWIDQPIASRVKVPLSCCKKDSKGEPINERHCQDQHTDYSQVYSRGCYTVLEMQAESYITPLSSGRFAILLLLSLLFQFFCFYQEMSHPE
ncbi:uroplakin-1a-like [Antedon mediterranea]|uniref:uroplakin-1a-like n=1 Tax=Antedon mediterranea TaxID=105859 RepID=UPI003AF55E5F